MKVLAMYLPQFHRVKENDEWWGEGFTEWTAVKKAQPIYDGHIQPRRPLNDFYYDLLNKETMQWQAEILRKYDVDGLCFYHYYFKDGKKILEKPAENLLRWKDIDIPYCFSWANESWIRTWSNVNDGNVWMNSEGDKQQKDNTNGVLLEQAYGKYKEWEQHFYYLLPFFKDPRYIRKEGRPVFLIYKAGRIHCLSEMLKTWNELASKEGIPSLYVIGSNAEIYQEDILDEILIHEPQNTLSKYFQRNSDDVAKQKVYDYDEVWKKLLSKPVLSRKVCRGGFVNYDDTPRRGVAGSVIEGGTPEKFCDYLVQLLKISKSIQSEYVFINAWNEWGEGMYLEPDSQNGYQYLEAVKKAKEIVVGLDATDIRNDMLSVLTDEIRSLENTISRYRGYWKTLNAWLVLKEQNKSIASYFKKNRYRSIAVYGLGMLGKHLIEELKGSGICIKYGIDKEITNLLDFPVYSIQDQLSEVDVIVITVGYEFEKMKEACESKLKCDVVLLEKVIEEVSGY